MRFFFVVVGLGTDGGCTLDVNMTTWQWEKPKNSLVSGFLFLWPLGCIDSVRFFCDCSIVVGVRNAAAPRSLLAYAGQIDSESIVRLFKNITTQHNTTLFN